MLVSAANGTDCILESVAYVDVERNRAMVARVASAKPGEVIEVDPPDYINVRIRLSPERRAAGVAEAGLRYRRRCCGTHRVEEV